MIPLGIVATELEQHLLLIHGAPEEKLAALKFAMKHEEWVRFLVRSHYILHSIDRYGEYDDGQLHFEEHETDGPAEERPDPLD